ncbi:MAG: hypothetical protein HC779_01805 [Phyllobacteriaceae bacterium]|nr:hypothetical protein [Phyllobacteriaceae bacterium]
MTTKDTDFHQSLSLYKEFRSQVEHENELYNQRMHWQVLIQAILFATLGLIVSRSLSEGEVILGNLLSYFIFTICLTGMMISLIAFKVLANGRKAIKDVRKVWEATKDSLHPKIKENFLHPSGGTGASYRGSILRSGYIPLVFIASWVSIFILTADYRFGIFYFG